MKNKTEPEVPPKFSASLGGAHSIFDALLFIGRQLERINSNLETLNLHVADVAENTEYAANGRS